MNRESEICENGEDCCVHNLKERKMPFDYKKAKVDILNTLNSKVEISNKDAIPENDQLFNFQNGVKAWVGSIFVDMVDSTSFFTNNKCNRPYSENFFMLLSLEPDS